MLYLVSYPANILSKCHQSLSLAHIAMENGIIVKVERIECGALFQGIFEKMLAGFWHSGRSSQRAWPIHHTSSSNQQPYHSFYCMYIVSNIQNYEPLTSENKILKRKNKEKNANFGTYFALS